MAFESISPNMNLVLPGVGQTLGPQYATDLNNSLTIIDTHNHTAGYGVPVPSSGLNINADLTMANNNLTAIKSLRMQPQSILSGPSDLTCMFVNALDLYYNDGAGNHVRITQSGGVAGSPGSISNLNSPASATYVGGSQTFVWQSDANTPANMDNASIILRNLVANSFGLTLNPPAAMGANFALTLPTLPASQKIMTLDSSGNMSAPYDVDNITTAIVANNIVVKKTNIASVSIDTTTTPASSVYLVDTTSGNINITLQTAIGGGYPITIKKVSSDGNSVIILTTAGQTVDGAASGSPELSALNDSFTVQSDGANYEVISKYTLPIYGLAGLTGNQTLTNNTITLVTLGGINGSGITIGTGTITAFYDGFYDIAANLRFATNGAGTRSMFIRVNGSDILEQEQLGFGNGVDNTLSASITSFRLSAGDVVSVYARQTSGGNLDLNGSIIYSNSLSVSRVGVIGGV